MGEANSERAKTPLGDRVISIVREANPPMRFSDVLVIGRAVTDESPVALRRTTFRLLDTGRLIMKKDRTLGVGSR